MAVPYHLLKTCGDIIFAAQGTDIHSLNANFEYISTWKYPVKSTETTTEQTAAEAPQDETPEVSTPPTPEGPLLSVGNRTSEEEAPNAGWQTLSRGGAAPRKGRFQEPYKSQRKLLNALAPEA